MGHRQVFKKSDVTAKDRSPAFDGDALDHVGTLRTLSLRLAQDRTEAEDLVQDTYPHAFRASHRFTPDANLKAGSRSSSANLARNRRRDQFRARVRMDESGVARAAESHIAAEASPEQRLMNEGLGPALQAALESMPKALRDAVWLRDVEDMSYADMARRLRVPIGTVMSRISRGRRLLHDRMVRGEVK
jgi:RNA polymerase sigma-70 factor (ECF subfamily)